MYSIETQICGNVGTARLISYKIAYKSRIAFKPHSLSVLGTRKSFMNEHLQTALFVRKRLHDITDLNLILQSRGMYSFITITC